MVTPRYILITSVVPSKWVKMKTQKSNPENEQTYETELTIDEQIEQLAEIIIGHLLKQLYET
jgi:hypothetical protein